MKVGFWGNANNSGISTAAIGCAIADIGIYCRNVVFLQTPFQNNVEFPLTGEKLDSEAFSDIGIDALIRDFRSQPITEEIFISDGISLLGKKMNYFTSTRRKSEDKYVQDMNLTFANILNAIEKYTDDIIVDYGTDMGSYVIDSMKNLDVLVICLPQNVFYLDKFFENNFVEKLLGENDNLKVIYVILKYQDDSRYSVKNIKKKYRIKKELSVGINYCVELMDAANEGRVIQYILKVLETEKDATPWAFMNSIKQIMEFIIERR